MALPWYVTDSMAERLRGLCRGIWKRRRGERRVREHIAGVWTVLFWPGPIRRRLCGRTGQPAGVMVAVRLHRAFLAAGG